MDINKETRIGSIAAYDYRTVAVYRKYNIDFCCRGESTIAEVCKKTDLHADALIRELKDVMALEERAYANFNYWPVDLLTDYIEKKHHRYARERTLLIRKDFYILNDLCANSGLTGMNECFCKVSDELEMHMKKEEDLLFPHIREIAMARQENRPLENSQYASLDQPIAEFFGDHVFELNAISRLSKQIQNATCPPQYESRLKNVSELLVEFESDLYLHTHLENNILFPKALEMDNTVER